MGCEAYRESQRDMRQSVETGMPDDAMKARNMTTGPLNSANLMTVQERLGGIPSSGH
jgi:hypothetical protein